MPRFISFNDPLNLLLVEDSRGDAILIEKTLEKALPGACKLMHVTTLAKALKTLEDTLFDVALLDRSLPDVTGFSGLISIQNMAPELPIIYLTAYKDEAVALSAVENGAQDYLFKDKVDEHVIKRAIQFAIHRKQFESILINQANFDGLTGLANRILFESRLEMALARINRGGNGIGIFFLDLNRFKQVNDTFGHYAGDQLLKEVAERLKKSVRPYDTAARFGGDEFALLIEGITGPDQCAQISQKIIRRMEEPFEIAGKQIGIGVSIGITTCTNNALSKEQLLAQADAAMYAAKNNKQSAFVFYNQLDQQPASVISKCASKDGFTLIELSIVL